ncbi:fasciclin domain-containing protein [Pseudarthrobacter sp. SL88]|uniref:Uncaracterized surface protein containing fasciclin (FAS1) repeats n=1 Tax=Pseudarthrobacter equi TaxID=728066 RepID=A0A1H1ZXY8_9MICC|nr:MULTISPECIES: fasciclin domain-containing protein [Micrococcaceae]MDQ1055612.1 putative surface protein with fasciclin (FAS1) repeats [Arthrobacter sp. SORGH_AS_0212]KQQ80440.1 fasciclin [Arthrobacter sp. Leaf137]MCT9625057.1 fasciclin domain-containing protein [Pseudarthrobacter equi]MCY1674416.1 fasciclin domain-containing protein [Pseudarthrobacter sp. SL88]SDT38625.1 Uncaracterized surface protein containing fasciclin (FAS1) repeats [Pseudarthrobacter equi]
MQTIKRTTFTVAGVAAAALLSLTACGGSGSTSGSSSAPSAEPSASSMAASPSASSTASASAGAMDPAANLVGPGCAGYAEKVPTGAGSVQGMALDPVAVAASNNPILTTLTAAVSGKLNPKVDLVDTLNGGEFTVFAPVDDAFAKIDPATIETLKTDDALLSKILTYHVVPGQITPDMIAGTHATVQGGSVTVTGSGDNLKVDDANVICGGVKTKNATVYLVDSVLMPK